MANQKSEAPKLTEVTLLTPHEHEGKQYQAGEKISVNEPDRIWLAEQKIIAPPK